MSYYLNSPHFRLNATVDMTSTGNTSLGVIDILYPNDGERAYPLQAFQFVREQSGVVTPAIFNIGTNSPNYDNIVSGATSGLTINLSNLTLKAIEIGDETEVFCRVTTAAVGVSPTLDVGVILWGIVTNYFNLG